MALPEGLPPFDSTNRENLERRASALVEARARARDEYRLKAERLPRRVKVWFGTAASLLGVAALVGSIIVGDPLSILAGLSAFSTLTGAALAGEAGWEYRNQVFELRDLEIQLAQINQALKQIDDALSRLHGVRR